MGALAEARAAGDMDAGADAGADTLGIATFAIVGTEEAIAALGLGVAAGDMAAR